MILAIYLWRDWLYGEAWIWLSSGESDPARTIRDIVLALAAPISIILAVWRSRITTAGFLRDRYQRSAEMLGHSDLRSVRLGGIYALADLAGEHRRTFHVQTMQLFAAFVVERTNLDTPEPSDVVKDTEAARDTGILNESEPNAETQDFEQLATATWSEGSDVLDLQQDVREAIKQIARRDWRQVALERKKGLRLNLSGAVLVRLVEMDPAANFSNVDFSDANLSRARLWKGQFFGAVMAGTRLCAASLYWADLRKVDMRGADLTGARLTNAILRQADLGPRNRVGEWAGGWKNRVTRLRGASLEGADMREAKLCGADLRLARLSGANLDNANLSGADLRKADLRSTVLYEANLMQANLADANLGGLGADLRRAKLAGADLTRANLSRAVLTGADLSGANLSGAEFSRHHLAKSGIAPTELLPATGLTQEQLDRAQADQNCPPHMDGVQDSVTKRPLVWRGNPV